MLPGVLVFILAVTKSAIRTGRRKSTVEDRITLADLKVAMNALREVETNINIVDNSLEEKRKKIQEQICKAMSEVSSLQELIYNLARERDVVDEELRKSRDGEKSV